MRRHAQANGKTCAWTTQVRRRNPGSLWRRNHSCMYFIVTVPSHKLCFLTVPSHYPLSITTSFGARNAIIWSRFSSHGAKCEPKKRLPFQPFFLRGSHVLPGAPGKTCDPLPKGAGKVTFFQLTFCLFVLARFARRQVWIVYDNISLVIFVALPAK